MELGNKIFDMLNGFGFRIKCLMRMEISQLMQKIVQDFLAKVQHPNV